MDILATARFRPRYDRAEGGKLGIDEVDGGCRDKARH